MAALLRDVGDAVTATSEPNFSFEAPIMDECHGKENDAKAANDGIGAQAQAEGTTSSINKDEVTGLKQQVATEAAETREQQRMLLKQDPTTFQPAKLTPELERAVTKFKANKYDLLFFTIVHDKHWIIVCANLLYKQWNVFDSIHSKGKQSPLKKQANNLITNFAALAQEYSQFNVDVGSFARVDLEDYPKQDNLCDCGFFGLKYVENFDGKSMKEFNQEDVARYRMDVVHNLCTHPMNNAPMERAFNEELAA
ncbi:putative ubiquitin-like-specific protease 1B [Triticum aestivum]|uniref:putative ubiquitin-like-specific protease 1B n=1 Tax=Triticum aestivum TaxID=4565 RepID=UPI001D008A84|nr:putative ubiquitin-like-specific protease 1B [Triticum aestivum]